MEDVLAFVAEPGVDSSLAFRALVARVQPLADVATLSACLRAALAAPPPTRAAAALGVLQDVLERHVAAVQEVLFGAVEEHEAHVAALLEDASSAANRNALLTCVLDLCRGSSPLFRARLLRFLSVVMPPLDKSGLNMRGAFAPASCAALPADAPTWEHLDYMLHGHFVRLQQLMSGGTASLSKSFGPLKDAVEAVLLALAACPPLVPFADVDADGDVAMTDAGAAPTTLEYFHDPEVLLAHFSPHFDQHGLFKLQLLVQLAMWLSALTSAQLKTPAGTESELQWVRATLKLVHTEVRRVCGSQKWLERLLRRDTEWSAWRSDGAKTVPLTQTHTEALQLMAETVPFRLPKVAQSQGMGNAELTRLWALGASWSLDTDSGSNVVQPDWETFVKRVRDEEDPENGIEDTYRIFRNPVFEWKTFRRVLEQKPSELNFPLMFKIKADLVTLAMRHQREGLATSAGGHADKDDEDDAPAKRPREQDRTDASAPVAVSVDGVLEGLPEDKKPKMDE